MKTNNSTFSGFSEEVRKFLADLTENNNRDWFLLNKEFYENKVKSATHGLVSVMSERFAVAGLSFVSNPKASLFRINRDIRFGTNKDPYKTYIGVWFPFSAAPLIERNIECPGLYFHLEKDVTFIAAGIHIPQMPLLRSLRTLIDEEWQQLDEILSGKTFKMEFPKIFESERYKRVPQGFSADHPRKDWLMLKEFIVSCDLSFKDTETVALADLLERKAKVIEPFLRFLQLAIDDMKTV